MKSLSESPVRSHGGIAVHSPVAGFAACLLALGLFLPGVAAAQDRRVNELTQCRELTEQPDEIHNCLDNFLDALDLEMQSLELEVVDQLGGEISPLAMAFSDAQESYRTYQASNCLWYQSFSSPLSLAEQIAKTCLIDMSHARLDEINDLLRVNTAEAPNAVVVAQPPVLEAKDEVSVAGYYLFGVDRNSFQLCGSAARYWVEGNAEELAALQRVYNDQTSDDNPLLFVRLSGTTDIETDSRNYPGHEGVFRLAEFSVAQASYDGDCSGAAAPAVPLAASAAPGGEDVDLNALSEQGPASDNQVAAANSAVSETPAQLPIDAPIETAIEPPTETPRASLVDAATGVDDQAIGDPPLVAYFGEWTASCSLLGASFGCEVSTALTGNSVPDILRPVLKLVRRSAKRTTVDLIFPGQEIPNKTRIRWTIDANDLGVITASRLRVGDTAVVQELRQRAFIQRQLLPPMLAGYSMVITVIDNIEGPIPYNGTLVGLTRALAFADQYAESGGNI